VGKELTPDWTPELERLNGCIPGKCLTRSAPLRVNLEPLGPSLRLEIRPKAKPDLRAEESKG